MPRQPSQQSIYQAKGESIAKLNKVLKYTKVKPDLRIQRIATTQSLRGKHTGMSRTSFLYCLFRANEVRSRHDKLTDRNLQEQIILEFPNHDPHHPEYNGFWNYMRSMNRLRWYYNRGQYSLKLKPEYQSFRYGPKGDIIEGRYGRRLLTKEEVEKAIKHYEAYWEKVYAKEQVKADKIRATFDE